MKTPSYNNIATIENFSNNYSLKDLQYNDNISKQSIKGFLNKIPFNHPIKDLQYNNNIFKQSTKGFYNKINLNIAFNNNKINKAYNEQIFNMNNDINITLSQYEYRDIIINNNKDIDIDEINNNEDINNNNNINKEDLFIIYNSPLIQSNYIDYYVTNYRNQQNSIEILITHFILIIKKPRLVQR